MEVAQSAPRGPPSSCGLTFHPTRILSEIIVLPPLVLFLPTSWCRSVCVVQILIWSFIILLLFKIGSFGINNKAGVRTTSPSGMDNDTPAAPHSRPSTTGLTRPVPVRSVGAWLRTAALSGESRAFASPSAALPPRLVPPTSASSATMVPIQSPALVRQNAIREAASIIRVSQQRNANATSTVGSLGTRKSHGTTTADTHSASFAPTSSSSTPRAPSTTLVRRARWDPSTVASASRRLSATYGSGRTTSKYFPQPQERDDSTPLETSPLTPPCCELNGEMRSIRNSASSSSTRHGGGSITTFVPQSRRAIEIPSDEEEDEVLWGRPQVITVDDDDDEVKEDEEPSSVTMDNAWDEWHHNIGEALSHRDIDIRVQALSSARFTLEWLAKVMNDYPHLINDDDWFAAAEKTDSVASDIAEELNRFEESAPKRRKVDPPPSDAPTASHPGRARPAASPASLPRSLADDDGVENAPLEEAPPAKDFKIRKKEIAITFRRFPGTALDVLAMMQAKFPTVFAKKGVKFLIAYEKHAIHYEGVADGHFHCYFQAGEGERFQGTQKFTFNGQQYLGWIGKPHVGQKNPYAGWLKYCLKEYDTSKEYPKEQLLYEGIKLDELENLYAGLVASIVAADSVLSLIKNLEDGLGDKAAVRLFVPAHAMLQAVAAERTGGENLLWPEVQAKFAAATDYDTRVEKLEKFVKRYVFREGEPFDRFKILVLTGGSLLGKSVCMQRLLKGSALLFNNSFNLKKYKSGYPYAKAVVFDDIADYSPGSAEVPPPKFWAQAPDSTAELTDKYCPKVTVSPLPLIIICNEVPSWLRKSWYALNCEHVHVDDRHPLFKIPAAAPLAPSAPQAPPAQPAPQAPPSALSLRLALLQRRPIPLGRRAGK